MSDFDQQPAAEIAPEASPVAPAVRPKRTRLIAGIAIALVLVVGIATKVIASSPAVRVASALSGLFSADHVDLSMSMAVSATELAKTPGIDESLRTSGLPGVHTADQAATALSQLKLHVMTSGKGEAGATYLGVEYGDANVLSLQLQDRYLFLQSDIKTLPKQEPQVISQTLVSQAVSAVNSALGAQTWVSPLLDGDVLGINFKAGTPLGDVWDQSIGKSGALEPQSAATNKLLEAMVKGLKDSTTITEAGSTELKPGVVCDKFEVTVDGDKFGPAFAPAFAEYATGAGIDTKASDVIKALVGQKLAMTLWLQGSDLRELDFDLGALADASLAKGALVMKMEVGDQVLAKPSRFTDVTGDVEALLMLFTGQG